MSANFVLYTDATCPFSLRVELALTEATKGSYNRYEIPLDNKPEWYSKVNPALKVPTLIYGGNISSPENPPAESERLVESLVLAEFVADLYPESGLLPKDPVQRAKARLFIDAVSQKFVPAYISTLIGKQPPDALFEAMSSIQSLLPSDSKYFQGNDFTLADISILPFLAGMEAFFEDEIGLFEVGVGQRVVQALRADPKYERIGRYFEDLKQRESFKQTFTEATRDALKQAGRRKFPRN